MYIEYLDKYDNPVKEGENGRIVITDFTIRTMPFIRYEIEDVGKNSKILCNCGIKLPVMEVVEGRKEDFIKTNSGKEVHAAYLCYTLKADSIQEFKMYQKDINKFKVQLVKSSE